jgi:hypothetical protein
MEEIRGKRSEQLSNLLYVVTKKEVRLSKEDKAIRIRCSFVKITDIVSLHLLSICATFKDAEEEEGVPFRPTGSETMEEPKNPKKGKRRVSDVTDAFKVQILSNPETIISTQGPDFPVPLGYGSIDSSKPNSSVSCDSDYFPPSPKKLLKISQEDVKNASPRRKDNAMSSR